MEVEEEDKLHLAERLRSPPRSSFLHSAHNTIYHEGVCASLDLLSSRDALEELVGEKGFERRWRRESSLDNSGWQLSSPVSGASTPARRGGVGAGGTAAFPATRTPRTPRSARLRRAAGRRASSTLRKTYGPEGPAPRERPRRPSDAGSVTFLQFFSLLLAALAVIFAAAVGYGTWSFGAKRRACTLGVVQCPSGRERGREREGERGRERGRERDRQRGREREKEGERGRERERSPGISFFRPSVVWFALLCSAVLCFALILVAVLCSALMTRRTTRLTHVPATTAHLRLPAQIPTREVMHRVALAAEVEAVPAPDAAPAAPEGQQRMADPFFQWLGSSLPARGNERTAGGMEQQQQQQQQQQQGSWRAFNIGWEPMR